MADPLSDLNGQLVVGVVAAAWQVAAVCHTCLYPAGPAVTLTQWHHVWLQVVTVTVSDASAACPGCQAVVHQQLHVVLAVAAAAAVCHGRPHQHVHASVDAATLTQWQHLWLEVVTVSVADPLSDLNGQLVVGVVAAAWQIAAVCHACLYPSGPAVTLTQWHHAWPPDVTVTVSDAFAARSCEGCQAVVHQQLHVVLAVAAAAAVCHGRLHQHVHASVDAATLTQWQHLWLEVVTVSVADPLSDLNGHLVVGVVAAAWQIAAVCHTCLYPAGPAVTLTQWHHVWLQVVTVTVSDASAACPGCQAVVHQQLHVVLAVAAAELELCQAKGHQPQPNHQWLAMWGKQWGIHDLVTWAGVRVKLVHDTWPGEGQAMRHKQMQQHHQQH
jgi:pyruvate-formate lyase-activating enzyme